MEQQIDEKKKQKIKKQFVRGLPKHLSCFAIRLGFPALLLSDMRITRGNLLKIRFMRGIL